MKTNISVVIPNWNGEKFLVACLMSLVNQKQKAQIIVVENGSTDKSADLVKKQFPDVKLLEFDDNAGFAGGVNRGIKHAIESGAEFVALLNNDAVADENWLGELMDTAKQNPKAGIITGKLMRSDKKHIDSTGDFLTTRGMPFPRGRNEVDKGQYDKSEEVFGASGGASLYRVSMLKEIGLFDEDFFAYYEDVDISFRARLTGWKVIYQPKAIAYHHVGGTSSKLGSFARYHSVKNFILLYNRNMPGHLFWKYKLMFFYQLARMKIGAIRDKQFGAYCRGFFAGVKLLPKTWLARRQMKKTRKALVSEIEKWLIKGPPPRPPKLEKIR